MLRVGVIGSGSGSNLQAILNATEWCGLKVEVACVISDVEHAFILERARSHSVPAYSIDCAPSRSKLEGQAGSMTSTPSHLPGSCVLSNKDC